jgi:signal peptidase I
MSIYRRRTQSLLTGFWIALLAAIWFSLAPVQAGGQATYVIVAGQSMEPNFHYGDLVIVHKDTHYQVGDVVAYKNADLNRYVIHRIIDERRGRYRLKGDNNSWTDQYEPSSQEVLGKLWVHLPHFGTYMQKMREPIYMALFAGFIGSLVAGTLFASKQREKKIMEENSKKTELNIRKWLTSLGQKIGLQKLKKNLIGKRSDDSEISPTKWNPGQQSTQGKNMIETFFFALAVIAFLSLMLGILSFTRPATQTISDDVNYQHLGFFSYSAEAPAGVYDTNSIRSGEPIFPALTCFINVTFNYSLAAAPLENISGTYQLTAVLSHPQSGWQRTLPLQEQSPFSGSTFNTQATLNLCEVVKLIESVEEITGVHAGTYLLSINPNIHLTGLVAERALDTTFQPQLAFQYDRTQFFMVDQGDGNNPLTPGEAGILHEGKSIPNTLSLFGAELNVPMLRTIAVIGLALSLSGLLVLGFQLEYISRNDRETFVRMKYDPLVIDVDETGLNHNAMHIEVSSIDDLAKLAEKHNAMILHKTGMDTDQYLVHMDGFSYIYSQVRQLPVRLTPDLDNYRSEFKRGLENGEFQLHYQPIVSLVDGRITAVEALLRWQHPQRGMIPAGEFIQAAEMTGDIGKLDEWAMLMACTQLKAWQDAGLDLKLAVNLSVYHLERDPVELVQRILQKTNADPGRLQIEIPEAKVSGYAPALLRQLQTLRGKGIDITMDDFDGEVALSTISQMPVNGVKIDRLLVKKMGDPANSVSIQQIISVASTLGLNVVGKGVETDEEKLFLTKSGSQAQGFLLGRPVPAQEISEMVRMSKSTSSARSRGKSHTKGREKHE